MPPLPVLLAAGGQRAALQQACKGCPFVSRTSEPVSFPLCVVYQLGHEAGHPTGVAGMCWGPLGAGEARRAGGERGEAERSPEGGPASRQELVVKGFELSLGRL